RSRVVACARRTVLGRPADVAPRRPRHAQLARPRRPHHRRDRLGTMGVGDPACDVMVAWKLHSADARDAFREALTPDDATWERARGWALSQAIGAVTYYTPENNPSLYHEGEAWLALLRSERG